MLVDLSFWTYFADAGLLVKLVLLLLVTASIISWHYIFQRAIHIKKACRATSEFENIFWSGGDLTKIYTEATKNKNQLIGLQAIFYFGFKEFLRLHKQSATSPEAMLESAQRAMRVAQMHEQDRLEMHLPILATIGSISPYIGLFGTVWGMMLSLRALAHVQQATIAMVAPGIAEALIATAMGLFVAIPAVIAYNRYSTESNRLLNRYDAFQDEFTNILFRQVKRTGEAPAEANGLGLHDATL